MKKVPTTSSDYLVSKIGICCMFHQPDEYDIGSFFKVVSVAGL